MRKKSIMFGDRKIIKQFHIIIYWVENMVSSNYLPKLKSLYNTFSKADRKIADYLLNNPEKVIYMTITEFASKCDVSKASIVRFYTKLGLNGYQAFKVAITMNVVKTDKAIYDKNENREDLDHLLKEVTDENIKTLNDGLLVASKKNIRKAASLLLNAENVEIFGIGSSWITAEATKCKLLKLGIRCSTSPDLYFQSISATNLNKKSVALVISFSGNIPLYEALVSAKNNGAAIITICNYENTNITSIADAVLLTATTESPIKDGELTAIMGQLNVIDMLYTVMAMKKGDKHKRHLEKINEILLKLNK